MAYMESIYYFNPNYSKKEKCSDYLEHVYCSYKNEEFKENPYAILGNEVESEEEMSLIEMFDVIAPYIVAIIGVFVLLILCCVAWILSFTVRSNSDESSRGRGD